MEYRSRSRGLAVEHAILGFLLEAPMHGYELRDRLAQGLGGFWQIASSQLYLVLHRLEDQGWVECAAAEARSGGPARNVYRTTQAGEEAFWKWAASPVPHARQLRVEFLAKVYFLRRLAPNRLAALVEGQIAVLRRLSGHLEERSSIETDDAGLGALTLSFRQSRIRGTIGWLEENRRRLLEGRESE